MYYIIYL